MMRFVITNAFSINMLARAGQDITFVPVQPAAVRSLLQTSQWESAIGHADTAAVVSGIVGVEIPANRTNVQLVRNETSLIVAQYRGPRLEEGATVLPEGASLEFWQVYHIYKGVISV